MYKTLKEEYALEYFTFDTRLRTSLSRPFWYSWNIYKTLKWWHKLNECLNELKWFSLSHPPKSCSCGSWGPMNLCLWHQTLPFSKTIWNNKKWGLSEIMNPSPLNSESQLWNLSSSRDRKPETRCLNSWGLWCKIFIESWTKGFI